MAKQIQTVTILKKDNDGNPVSFATKYKGDKKTYVVSDPELVPLMLLFIVGKAVGAKSKIEDPIFRG